MRIRPATAADADAIWEIFRLIVAGRDTYAFSPDTPRDEGLGYWFGPDITSFVADLDGQVRGMYKLIPNRRDLGAHVANASYMVHPAATGRGIGHAMGTHSLHEARAHGYDAMQFNFVVSTNRSAVSLWQRLGFRIVGTLPQAFQHGTLGRVDAFVMHRSLDDIVLTFGTPPSSEGAEIRPSVYAVIANVDRAIALVNTPEGTLLPGGGIDPGESADAAVLREVEEECALRVIIKDRLGDAVQFVHSTRLDTHFEKRSTFVSGVVVGASDRSPEHATEWVSTEDAMRQATYPSHAWAIRRWARLNM